MNWHASLLRNQLKKQKIAYEQSLADLSKSAENKLNLLTEASLEASNYLALEEKLKNTEQQLSAEQADYEASEKILWKRISELEAETEEKDQLANQLAQQIQDNKDKIFNLNKQIRELHLYHQRNLKANSKEAKERLAQAQKQVKALTILANHRQEQISSLSEQLAQEKQALILLAKQKISKQKAAQELLAQLETTFAQELESLKTELKATDQQLTATKKEKAQQGQELAVATGKLQALEKIFRTQITEIIRKNIIFRKSKDLKEALRQIKELMGWTGLVLPTDTAAGTSSNTPLPEEQ